MTETTVTINNAVGLHARPAALFYRTARQFKSRVTIENLDRPAAGELVVSTANLMRAGVKSGHTIRIRADGEDEATAIATLVELVNAHFGEDAAPTGSSEEHA